MQRRQNHKANSQSRGSTHTEGFCLIIGQRLGGDLTKNQNNDRQHNSRGRRTIDRTQQLRKENGSQCGSRQIDNIIANQNAGENFVILLQQVQCILGAGIAILRFVLQANLVDRRVGRLRGGTPCREPH